MSLKHKYEVVHFRKSNVGTTYTVNGEALRSAVDQRDQGVRVHGSLKVELQVDRMVK